MWQWHHCTETRIKIPSSLTSFGGRAIDISYLVIAPTPCAFHLRLLFVITPHPSSASTPVAPNTDLIGFGVSSDGVSLSPNMRLQWLRLGTFNSISLCLYTCVICESRVQSTINLKEHMRNSTDARVQMRMNAYKCACLVRTMNNKRAFSPPMGEHMKMFTNRCVLARANRDNRLHLNNQPHFFCTILTKRTLNTPGPHTGVTPSYHTT